MRENNLPSLAFENWLINSSSAIIKLFFHFFRTFSLMKIISQMWRQVALVLFFIAGSIWVLKMFCSGRIFLTLHDAFKSTSSNCREFPNIASYSSVLSHVWISKIWTKFLKTGKSEMPPNLLFIAFGSH